MACCIGLMLLASCKKDPIAPTISVFNGAGYAAENTQIFSGDQVSVGFVATGKDLTQMEVTLSQNGTTITQHSENIEKLDLYNYSHTFDVVATGDFHLCQVFAPSVRWGRPDADIRRRRCR